MNEKYQNSNSENFICQYKSETKIGFQEKKIEIEGNPTLCEISCWFLDRFHNIIVIKKLNKLAN